MGTDFFAPNSLAVLAEFYFSVTGSILDLHNDVAKPQPFDSSGNKTHTYWYSPSHQY